MNITTTTTTTSSIVEDKKSCPFTPPPSVDVKRYIAALVNNKVRWIPLIRTDIYSGSGWCQNYSKYKYPRLCKRIESDFWEAGASIDEYGYCTEDGCGLPSSMHEGVQGSTYASGQLESSNFSLWMRLGFGLFDTFPHVWTKDWAPVSSNNTSTSLKQKEKPKTE